MSVHEQPAPRLESSTGYLRMPQSARRAHRHATVRAQRVAQGSADVRARDGTADISNARDVAARVRDPGRQGDRHIRGRPQGHGDRAGPSPGRRGSSRPPEKRRRGSLTRWLAASVEAGARSATRSRQTLSTPDPRGAAQLSPNARGSRAPPSVLWARLTAWGKRSAAALSRRQEALLGF
jgi:hypothetical protein